ncbi:MAG: type II secretion system protein [Smithellaceae bacterium]|jgi:MSHA pilin protein MshC
MNFLKKKTKNSRGMTLLEIIAVLVVVGIVSAIAVSRLTLAGTQLYTERDILQSNLRFAQFRALTDNAATTTTWGISFAGGTYTLQTNGAAATIFFPSDGSATHTLSAGVTITAPASGSSVTYNFWGNPGAANIPVTLSQGGQIITFTITGTTGFMP